MEAINGLVECLENLDAVSIAQLSEAMRDAASNDLKKAMEIISKNCERIVDFFEKQIPNTSLGEIGVFLYTIHTIGPEVFRLTVKVLLKYRDMIILRSRQSGILEVAEFLSGISFAEDILDFIRHIVSTLKADIGKHDIHEIGEFLACLSIAEPSIVREILFGIISSVERMLHRWIVEGSLNDIALFFSSVGKIDKKTGIRLLRMFKKDILSVFDRRYASCTIDDLTSFILLMAQVDISFVDEVLEKYGGVLEARYGKELSIVKSLVKRIRQLEA